MAASGYEGYFPRLISHFSKEHDVCLITYDKGELKNVKTFRLNNHENYRPLNKLLMPWHLTKIRKLLKEIKPDVVHGHYLTSYGVYTALSSFHPVINSSSGSDVLLSASPNSLLYKIILKTVLKNSDVIIAVSRGIEKMLTHFGYPTEKIVVIPVGVDTNLFRKQPSKSRDLLQLLRINKNDKIIISVRSFAPIYNVECLIQALPLILKKIPNVKVILLGGGPSRLKLEETVKKLQLENYVNFVGAVRHKDVPNYLNLADVYVSTSLSDGTSSALLEAMACQLPLVVSDTEANKEWIKDGKNGLLFEKGNYQDLANKVVFLLENECLKEKMSDNRHIIFNRSSWEENMKEVEKLYLSFMD